MEEFIDHLKKGKFLMPVCISCGSKAWPPSRRCQHCMGKTTLKQVRTTATLIEFSRSHIRGMEGSFGVVDMAGIRLVASFEDHELKVGMKVRMSGCGIRQDGTAFYLFAPAGLDINIRRVKNKHI